MVVDFIGTNNFCEVANYNGAVNLSLKGNYTTVLYSHEFDTLNLLKCLRLAKKFGNHSIFIDGGWLSLTLNGDGYTLKVWQEDSEYVFYLTMIQFDTLYDAVYEQTKLALEANNPKG